jgi:phosphatidylserine synthase
MNELEVTMCWVDAALVGILAVNWLNHDFPRSQKVAFSVLCVWTRANAFLLLHAWNAWPLDPVPWSATIACWVAAALVVASMSWMMETVTPIDQIGGALAVLFVTWLTKYAADHILHTRADSLPAEFHSSSTFQPNP